MKPAINRIDFDPSNPEHREVFKKFIKQKRWDLHFKIETPWLELPAMISEKLLLWYMEQETSTTKVF